MKIQQFVILLIALACPNFDVVQNADAADAYPVIRSEDDAEEGADGQVNLSSDDLDLGQASGFESAVAIGIRFDGIRISNETKLKRAFVQFTQDVSRIKAEPTDLTIRAELSPHAQAFKERQKDISSRSVTESFVNWSLPPWHPDVPRGDGQRTPDLSPLIQEVVGQSDWKSGAALVLIITGTGERDAMAFDGGGKEHGPVLHLETE